ncbi:MAG TPA: lysylphosphatidylglycerol synthase transmembrane domain-containing protein [Pseudomonadales bacterium]|nr:lysylphosphatidylglycerol synthase transmembrane domain-containing protein [Pseudomonadales bacterium]
MNRFRFLVYSIVIAVGGYGLWAGMNDGQKILHAVSKVGVSGLLLLCSLSLLNYVLRYIRWYCMLRRLGDKPSWFDGLLCYWAGFALTTTPGKAGEAIRCLYFRNRHGVDNTHSLAALLTERVADLLAAMLLATGMLMRFEHFRWIAWVLLSVAALILLLVFMPSFALSINAWLHARAPHSLQPFFAGVPRFMERSASLLSPPVLTASVALGVLSWSAEAFGFAWLAIQLGSTESVVVLGGMFALSMIAGALLPGGLGGTEAAMAMQLAAVGMGPAEAFVVALICRLSTLWLAILIGLFAMLWLDAKPFPAEANR